MAHSIKKKIDPHYGWSIDEKRHLYEALRLHGHSDIDLLRRAVPSKSKRTIEKYLTHFRKFAERDLRSDQADIALESNPRRLFIGNQEVEISDNAPLCQWLNVFTENSKRLNLTLSVALKLIAHLETHPDPGHNSGVNLKELYLYLGKAFAGDIPVVCDPKSMGFLTCSLVDLATKTKRFRTTADMDFIQGITRLYSDRPASMLSVDSSAPTAVNEIQVSSTYNPLGLAANSLKRYPDT